MQCYRDASISAELRQVADGFNFRVMSCNVYDVNGYRFHTTSYEQSRPHRRTTNTGVMTPGTDGKDYYGILEEIYELQFRGAEPFSPVIFKCRWFDPEVSRQYPHLGLVETRQDSVYEGDDVWIVATQAKQVYYSPYACQTEENLKGWYVVHTISPHGRLPLPNDEDYNLNPETHDGEFYQHEEGLQGSFEIDLTGLVEMETDIERVVDEDSGDEVENPKDIVFLDRLHLGVDSDDEEADEDLDMVDSDDDMYNPANPDRGDRF